MSTMIHQMTETTILSGKNKTGLVLCGLLGAADVASLAALSQHGTDNGPPAAVLVANAVLGVLTIAAVIFTWRTRSRLGARIAAAARVLSALTAVPAFFVDDVSTGFIAGGGAVVVLTLLAVWLLLSRPDGL